MTLSPCYPDVNLHVYKKKKEEDAKLFYRKNYKVIFESKQE
jgi:hypothetical protein